MAILILGNVDDQHAAHMLTYLRQRGQDVQLLDSRQFPTTMAIQFNPIQRTGSLQLSDDRTLRFDQITAVYCRNYFGVAPPQIPDPEQSYIAMNDSRCLFESMLLELPARWVNSWPAIQLHQTKPVQLARIAALGVKVPDTLITNDPQSVRHFAQRHPRIIFKPVQGGAHTRTMEARHLTEGNLQSLKVAPVTLQEEIPGTDVRVFVAGDRVAACQLITSELDYRKDPNPRIEAIELSEAMQASSRQIARTLGLLWTGIDFRRTPAGDHIFLEANPSPMFLGFEARSRLPLTRMLGDLLIGDAAA